MAWNPFQLLIPKQYLGIDVGTSFVKIVEISKFGNRRKLENYGSLNASVLYEKPFRTFEKSTLLLSGKDVARAITAILEEAQIKTKQAIFSIPDFSTFFTSFELPLMSNEELAQAVKYEARQVVPIPPAEVTLDWQVIDQRITEEKKTSTKILLLAVPNEVINQYKEIAVLANLELVALEAEAFGLKRALVKEDEKEAVALIDIGAQSTNCNIVDKKILKTSYSFDVSGNELTEIISKSLSVDFKEAEELKSKYGLKTLSPEEMAKTGDIRQILLPLTDIIWGEAEKVFNNFFRAEGREVKKVILAGGSALTPGMKEYFSIRLRREVEIADPFSNIFYPPILEKTLKEMGPSFSVAVGMALRELDY